MTYTLVQLKVPAAFHRYVAEKLREAEYHHAFLDGGAALDMTHIALVVDPDAPEYAPVEDLDPGGQRRMGR